MAAKNIDGQLARLRNSFSNGQLAIIGALSVIGLVATLAFLRWVSQPSYRPLITGATATEARDATDTLQKDGIGFKLADNGTTVMVRSADLGKARLSTGSTGTGSGSSSNVVGLELFDSQSFTTSDFQQRVGYQRALQGELTRSLLKIDGITSASVELAMPPDRLFAKDQKPTQASVLVGSDGVISSGTVKSIVQLVSSAVPGLEPDKVTVTNTRGQVLTDSGAASGDQHSELTTQYELELAAKAESMLAQAYGQGRVIVRVAAALNFDTKNTETTTYKPDQTVPVKSTDTTESFKGTGSPPGGVVGVEGSVADSSTGANDYTHTEKTNESVVGSTVEKATTAPGSVERLTAAAIVDQALDPAPDPTQIQSLIAAAIGIDEKRGDTVVVQTVKMPTIAEDTVSAARTDPAKAATPVFDYARIGVGAFVLLLVLFILRRGLRTTSEVIDLTNERLSPANAAAAATRGSTANGTPSELRLIDAEPAELANILRSWAGDRREVPTRMTAATLDSSDSHTRAALTLVALGSDRAANVLRALPEDVAMKLVREIERLGPVDATTAQQVLSTVADELKHKTFVAHGGPAYSQELSRRAFGAERAEAMSLARANATRFAFLANAPAADVARVLSSEPLSIVTLVVAHLEPGVAAAVISRFPTPTMADVSLRLAQLRPVHESVITLVEDDLRTRLAPLLGQRIAHFDGLQLLAQLMNNSTKELEQELLVSMRDRDPALADQLREMLFVFDDIARLADRGVQELLKAVDTRVLSVAMKSAPAIVTDKFFKNMSERARENLREEIEFLRGVKPSDIRDAQKAIVSIVRQLEAAGTIVIERAGGEDGDL